MQNEKCKMQIAMGFWLSGSKSDRENILHFVFFTFHFAFLVLLCLLFPLFAFAQGGERILDFHSDITVQANAELMVKETIRVRADNEQIRHGIFRDFPTEYRDRAGNRIRIRFELLGVQRDGIPEAYRLDRYANGVRIYIGDPGRYVPVGVHTYALRYRVNREIGFFEDHDELYWNVTGNGWAFPIDHASAVVTLPAGIPEEEIGVKAFTGPQGATGTNYRAEVRGNAQAVFETTAPLAPEEGLTIVVTFPKGFVAEPTVEQRARWLLRDNLALLAGLLGLAAVLGYYLFVWTRVGRDLPRGTIIPLFAPPEGLSPAMVRYIRKMGYDNKGLSAAVINLAVKGYLTIEEKKGPLALLAGSTYVLHRAESAPARRDAPSPEEWRLLEDLLPAAGDSIELKNENYRTFQQAVGDVKKDLKARAEPAYFVTNQRHYLPGLLLSLLVMALMAYLLFKGGAPEAIGGLLFTFIPLIIYGAFLAVLIPAMRTGSVVGRVFSIIGLVFLTLFCGMFLLVGFFMIQTPFALIALTAVLIGSDVLFYHLLKAPTRRGRTVLDAIEGFRLYLTVAEEDRLNAMHPPERTPELFERFLPYALALDTEHAWAERFTDVLQRAQVGGQTYHPAWYAGSAWNVAQPAGFADTLGSSISGAIASSSTAPGSSGGGGGSSGGGGGGGGGGGW